MSITGDVLRNAANKVKYSYAAKGYCTMEKAKEKIFQHFESVRDTLVERHEGKWVLISISKETEIFHSPGEAYDVGARRYGPDRFIVQPIEALPASVGSFC
ncbi:MAG: hypothetical protein AAF788_05615 [Pseudomonadota bacterium]